MTFDPLSPPDEYIPSLLKSTGEFDKDCLNEGCGRLNRGDNKKYCCGEVSRFGGYDYCHGTSVVGAKCWFDEQCENEGYCETVCYAAKKIGDLCDNDDECQNSVAYCDVKCKLKLENDVDCESDESCLSGACGRKRHLGNSRLVCCESGDVFSLDFKHYCTATSTDQLPCYSNDECTSGYCKGKRLCVLISIFLHLILFYFISNPKYLSNKKDPIKWERWGNVWVLMLLVKIVLKEMERMINVSIKSVD